MPFRPAFDCLWCGRAWRASGEADLTGWASLCPDCLERAQDNSFLRYRLRAALRERSGGTTPTPPAGRQAPVAMAPAPVLAPPPVSPPVRAPMATGHHGDDWYLRRGRYGRGVARDLAWHAELDALTTWVDGLPLAGRIVELAAGAGWWSPLLAGKGELSLYDTDETALDQARDRLVAHRLRAHIHVRDPWQEPDAEVDGLFCGFWLGQVPDAHLGEAVALVRRWLRPGGRFGFVDSLGDPDEGPVDGPPEMATVARSPALLEDALALAGFDSPVVQGTGRFFVMGTAITPG